MMPTDGRETSLSAGKAAVLAALRGLTVEDAAARPADGGWSAWEIAYHLFDIERWYIAKLCEAVAPGRSDALDRFITIWSWLREESIRLARAIPAQRLSETGLLSGVPDWTPAGLIAAIAAHDREHAAQALSARGRAPAPRSGTEPPRPGICP